MKIWEMPYRERLMGYECEKRRLFEKGLTCQEYEKEIQRLARKWRV